MVHSHIGQRGPSFSNHRHDKRNVSGDISIFRCRSPWRAVSGMRRRQWNKIPDSTYDLPNVPGGATDAAGIVFIAADDSTQELERAFAHRWDDQSCGSNDSAKWIYCGSSMPMRVGRNAGWNASHLPATAEAFRGWRSSPLRRGSAQSELRHLKFSAIAPNPAHSTEAVWADPI